MRGQLSLELMVVLLTYVFMIQLFIMDVDFKDMQMEDLKLSSYCDLIFFNADRIDIEKEFNSTKQQVIEGYACYGERRWF